MLGHKHRQFKTHASLSLEALVPADHFYREVETKLDLSLVRGEMWERLLDFVGKGHRQTVDYYCKYLESRFPTEVSAIYERVLCELLAEKAIKMVCQYLRRMQKLGQGGRVDEIVAELRTAYKHRPALMEELAGL